MEAAATFDALADLLRDLPAGSLIAVEGHCSAGKTSLTDRLANMLDAEVIHTDNFLKKFDNPPSYVECLDIQALKQALGAPFLAALRVVEGICLRDVLAVCGVSAHTFVYIKRIGKNGLWYDELHLEQFESADPVDGDTSQPHHSDYSYHARVRPHEIADLIYCRVEE